MGSVWTPFGQLVGVIVCKDAKCRLKLFERCAIVATSLQQRSFVLGFVVHLCLSRVGVFKIGMHSSHVMQTTCLWLRNVGIVYKKCVHVFLICNLLKKRVLVVNVYVSMLVRHFGANTILGLPSEDITNVDVQSTAMSLGLVYTIDHEVGPWRMVFFPWSDFMVQLSWYDLN